MACVSAFKNLETLSELEIDKIVLDRPDVGLAQSVVNIPIIERVRGKSLAQKISECK